MTGAGWIGTDTRGWRLAFDKQGGASFATWYDPVERKHSGLTMGWLVYRGWPKRCKKGGPCVQVPAEKQSV